MPLARRLGRFKCSSSNNSSSKKNNDHSGVSALRVLNFLSVVRWAGLKRDAAPRDTSKARGYTKEERERSVAGFVREVFAGSVEGQRNRNNVNDHDNDGDYDDVTTTTVDGDFDSSRSTGADESEKIGPTTSTPRRDSGSLDDLLQTPFPRARLRSRSVSFNEVVKEVFIETRQQRYGDLATKREAFYSHAELAVFKRAWVWHDRMSDRPMGGLMSCDCSCCDGTQDAQHAQHDQHDQHHDNTQNKENQHLEGGEESVSALPAHAGLTGVVVRADDTLLLRDYSKWTWEG